MQASIFFLHQYCGITPGTLARSNDARFQHFLQVIPNLFIHWGWDHLNCSLNVVSSVTFIVCSVEWVQPNSAGSNKNMSWYLARSWQAVSYSSRIHESRPLRSNSSNNLPCLCLTVSAEVGELWDSPTFSSNFSPLGGSGTGNATTTLATGVFFKGFVGRQYCSVPPQLLSYCLSLTWYKCSV